MIYDDIADVLAAATLPDIDSASQIFVYSMPADVSVGILLAPIPNTFYVNDEMPGYYRGEFLVVVRHKTQEQAQTLAEAISGRPSAPGALDTKEYQGNGRFIKRMKATTLPHAFPRSDGDFYEFLIQAFIVFTE
jgi:hypothetical protein